MNTETTSLLKFGHFLNNWIKVGIVKERQTICSFKKGFFSMCFLVYKMIFLMFFLGILCISEGEIGWYSVLVASHYYLDELWGFLYKVYDVRVD